MAITVPQLAAYIDPAAPVEDEHMPVVVGAVNAWVVSLHGEEWPADVELGALMLAARLHKRRNSPTGIDAVGDIGVSYVSRYDSDLDRLLRLNAWATPQVG